MYRLKSGQYCFDPSFSMHFSCEVIQPITTARRRLGFTIKKDKRWKEREGTPKIK
jgi:hypothetical protein